MCARLQGSLFDMTMTSLLLLQPDAQDWGVALRPPPFFFKHTFLLVRVAMLHTDIFAVVVMAHLTHMHIVTLQLYSSPPIINQFSAVIHKCPVLQAIKVQAYLILVNVPTWLFFLLKAKPSNKEIYSIAYPCSKFSFRSNN